MIAPVPTAQVQIDQHLLALKEEVAQILNQNCVTGADSGTYLSHFTTQENLVRMLYNYHSSGAAKARRLSLWLSDISCLNDPLEGRALFQFVDDQPDTKQPKRLGNKTFSADEWVSLSKIVNWLRGSNSQEFYRRRDGRSRRILICSFTQDMDRLDLWRAYGKNGEGICLSMPLNDAVAEIRSQLAPISRLYYVRYLDEDKATVWKMLANHLRPIYAMAESMGLESGSALRTRATVVAECEQIFHLYKHQQYLNEHEMRLIKTYDADDPNCYPKSTDPFEPGLRSDLEINRVYCYSNPFFLGGRDCKIIIGPRVAQAERLNITLSTYVKKLWGTEAPEVSVSNVPYR